MLIFVDLYKKKNNYATRCLGKYNTTVKVIPNLNAVSPFTKEKLADKTARY